MIGDIWVVALLAVTMVSFILGNRMNERIRHHHPEIWDRLGRPTFSNYSPAHSLKAGRFLIFSGEYKRLNDAELNRYVLLARIVIGFVFVMLTTGAILMAVGKFG